MVKNMVLNMVIPMVLKVVRFMVLHNQINEHKRSTAYTVLLLLFSDNMDIFYNRHPPLLY